MLPQISHTSIPHSVTKRTKLFQLFVKNCVVAINGKKATHFITTPELEGGGFGVSVITKVRVCHKVNMLRLSYMTIKKNVRQLKYYIAMLNADYGILLYVKVGANPKEHFVEHLVTWGYSSERMDILGITV